jgi:hypothetical protein
LPAARPAGRAPERVRRWHAGQQPGPMGQLTKSKQGRAEPSRCRPPIAPDERWEERPSRWALRLVNLPGRYFRWSGSGIGSRRTPQIKIGDWAAPWQPGRGNPSRVARALSHVSSPGPARQSRRWHACPSPGR